jgi:hypothetical protein
MEQPQLRRNCFPSQTQGEQTVGELQRREARAGGAPVRPRKLSLRATTLTSAGRELLKKLLETGDNDFHEPREAAVERNA